MEAAFYIAGAVAIISTVFTITRLNAVHALLYLVVSLLAVAVAFYTMGAPLVAALEVIIYAGAIMVLFVFVVMMLNLGGRAVESERQLMQGKIWVGPVILSALLIVEVVYLIAHATLPDLGPEAACWSRSRWGSRCTGPTWSAWNWLPCCCWAPWWELAIWAGPYPRKQRLVMTGIPMGHALILAGILFALGLAGLLMRRNLIFILMSVEIMLNGSRRRFRRGGIAVGPT